MIVLACIGNSDDKLPQRRWAAFQLEFRTTILEERGVKIYGDWHSTPDSIYQNAAIMFETADEDVHELKGELAALATIYKQDSIAWNELTRTEMLGPAMRVDKT